MSAPRIVSALVLALLSAGAAHAVEPAHVIPLWKDKAPGETKDLGSEKLWENKPGDTVQRLSNVSVPTISVYPAPADKASGAAVLVAPGGGYSILAMSHEGTDVCAWLNSIGVTAILLKYRVPMREGQMPKKTLPPFKMRSGAMSIVRGKAADWGIDPARIGMLGFSAGGNLTAWTCCHDKREYEAIDKMDEQSYKPNFAVLVYAGGLIDKDQLRPEFKVTKETTPMCFFHASNDSSENSVRHVSGTQEGERNRRNCTSTLPAGTASACRKCRILARLGPIASTIGCRVAAYSRRPRNDAQKRDEVGSGCTLCRGWHQPLRQPGLLLAHDATVSAVASRSQCPVRRCGIAAGNIASDTGPYANRRMELDRVIDRCFSSESEHGITCRRLSGDS